jgi:3-phenylpropionate/trans-cinnamate dioxygenase ferredoxin reductase subunit
VERRVVIIGAGHAGARTAETLRRGGWNDKIAMISAEGMLPYERPAVSKSMLFGADGELRPLWPTDRSNLEIKTIHACATAIDRAAREVALADGARLRYSHLVIATGARPRKLAGVDWPGHRVFTLRTADDARRLRPHLEAGARLLIVGAGLIGLEVAAGACVLGLDVTVVEMAPRALVRAVPERIASEVAALHVERGVGLRLGVGVRNVRAHDDHIVAEFTDGTVETFDLALVAAGVVPRTDLAEAAGLSVDNGIVTNAHLATDDPLIFAVGDCTNFDHSLLGVRLRLESQQNAEEQGRYVARHLLGETSPFSAVPWFWSDQYDRVLQIAGIPALGVRVVEREIPGGRGSLHLDAAGRLVGAAAFGPPPAVAREIGATRRLIAQRAELNAEIIASPALDLREALRSMA